MMLTRNFRTKVRMSYFFVDEWPYNCQLNDGLAGWHAPRAKNNK